MAQVTDHELPRKVLHGSIALITIWLYWKGINISQVTPYIIAALVPIGTLELLRARYPGLNRKYIAVVGPLMRDSERTNAHINGVIWFLVGLSVVFVLFSKDIAFLSVLLLSWADLAASTFGRKWGKYTPKLYGKKSLAGSLAAFLVGVASTFLIYAVLLPAKPQYNPPSVILYNPHLSRMPLYVYALLVGAATSLSELFPIVDDNLSIPIVSSIVAWTAVRLTTLPYSFGVLA